MSFYQNQDNARRKTGLLVAYFIAAVVLIVAAVNLAVFFLVLVGTKEHQPLSQWLQSPLCWGLAGITLGAIAFGSLLRLSQLRQGGIAVAMMAGGTYLDPATRDPKEKILINVVEEMAIASGTSVPSIFILREEDGINAFVAGTASTNTVLAVTRGALEKLSRDELQGVIGHEFSHILNGDMALNVRLIGILAGILFIGQIGEFLLRGQSHRRYHHSRRSGKDGAQLIPVALALMAIGYVGLFFGRLIKAAISRQREFLADASSVQFTRNPEGIASALYAIQHYSGNGLLMNAHAEDMNHMCFGETVKMQLSSVLATHPPIPDRIRAIDPALLPRLKARFKKRDLPAAEAASAAGSAHAAPSAQASHAAAIEPSPELVSQFAPALAPNGPATQAVAAAAVKASVGQPTPAHYDYAQALHQQIPPEVLEQAHDQSQAATVLFALLLLESPATISLPEGVPEHTTTLSRTLKAQSPLLRLPLLEICLATLKQAPQEQRRQTIAHAVALIKADNKVTLSEFVYVYLIQQTLRDHKRPARTVKRYDTVEDALATLFSALVKVSGDTAEQQAANLNSIMQYYSSRDHSAQLSQPPSPKALHHALQQLSRLAPLLKQPVVDACVDCILHDGKAVIKEVELLRAICEALDCPLPPLITQPH